MKDLREKEDMFCNTPYLNFYHLNINLIYYWNINLIYSLNINLTMKLQFSVKNLKILSTKSLVEHLEISVNHPSYILISI